MLIASIEESHSRDEERISPATSNLYEGDCRPDPDVFLNYLYALLR